MNYEMLRDIARGHKRSLGFIAFLAVLNLVLALYLSLWQNPELARAQSEWFAKREALKAGQNTTAAASYDSTVRDLSAFRQRLIPKKEFPSFLSKLYDLSKSNSLVISAITYKPTPIKQEGIIAYGISFTLSGKYAAVKSFIADFERLKEMATIDSISLSSTSQTEEVVDLKVQTTAYLSTEGA
jgi:type IV pilus assembly protein PilO